ncbi:MAG: hypothetical protein PHF00_03475 [Elusimicrobia bacterium]|nr:hypothetical protein [Elusimicrobiota bacterium]
MILKTAVVVFLAVAARGGEAADVRLLPLSGRAFAFERLGNLTSFRCADADGGEDCGLLERLDLQPQVDWDRLAATARRKLAGRKGRGDGSAVLAVEYAVDRFGGPWRVSLRGAAGKATRDWPRDSAYVVAPDFPGYKVSLEDGKVSSVEVLRDRDQWTQACRESGLGEDGKPAKKRGLGGLFE